MLPHDLPTPPQGAAPSRRWKTVRISAWRVFNLLTAPRSTATHVEFPKVVNLPDGFRVLYSHYDALDNGFNFIVEHESFPEVDECCHPPELDVVWEVVQIARLNYDPPPWPYSGQPLPTTQQPFEPATIGWPVPEGPTCKMQ